MYVDTLSKINAKLNSDNLSKFSIEIIAEEDLTVDPIKECLASRKADEAARDTLLIFVNRKTILSGIQDRIKRYYAALQAHAGKRESLIQGYNKIKEELIA